MKLSRSSYVWFFFLLWVFCFCLSSLCCCYLMCINFMLGEISMRLLFAHRTRNSWATPLAVCEYMVFFFQFSFIFLYREGKWEVCKWLSLFHEYSAVAAAVAIPLLNIIRLHFNAIKTNRAHIFKQLMYRDMCQTTFGKTNHIKIKVKKKNLKQNKMRISHNHNVTNNR